MNRGSGLSFNQGWKAESTTSSKIKQIGNLIADEFDLRSDDENIFVLLKILEAKTQVIYYKR